MLCPPPSRKPSRFRAQIICLRSLRFPEFTFFPRFSTPARRKNRGNLGGRMSEKNSPLVTLGVADESCLIGRIFHR